MVEIRSEYSLGKALANATLLSKGSSKELISYLKEVSESNFISYSRGFSTASYRYLCQALISLAKLDGEYVRVKANNYSKEVISYDFIQDCISYISCRVDPEELAHEYPLEMVFRARMIWNSYNSKVETLQENIKLFDKFSESFKELPLFKAIFMHSSSEALADMDEEEFVAFLSTCDVDEKSKDIIEAIFTVLPTDKEVRKYAIEDLFINQKLISDDTRIDVEQRLELIMIQILAYDNELSQSLRVGWSNALDGKLPVELII